MKLRATFSAVSVALLTLVPAAAAYQSYLQAPAVASYNVTSAGFTVECWVKVRDQPGFDPRIIRCVGPTEGPCGDSSSEVWQLWICKESACLPKGGVYFGLQDNGVCVGEVLSTVSITDGQYHHIAGTYDGAFVRVYVDGALSNSRPQSGLNVQVSGGKLVVGNSTGYNNQFDGQIDEVRIWSVARSDSQIASAMATEITPGPGLVGYWRLNGNGTDISVGGNTLVPSPNGGITFVAGQLNQAADISNPDTPPCSTLLAAAQGVAASSGERCLVRVSWQDVAGETGYRIYRNGGLAGSVAADVLQFNDEVPAGTYDYCVAAYDSCGESARTCATGTSASPPAFLGTNGNYYERVTVPFFTWTASKAAAESYRFLEHPGHLATVSDGVENSFLVQLGAPNYWLGGFQSPNSPNPAANWQWV